MLTNRLSVPAKPQRVAIIGAGGFIGGAIAARLRRDGVPTLAIGRAEVDLLASDAADQLATLLLPGDSVVTAAAIAPCKTAAMLKDNMVLSLALVTALARVEVAHVINIGSDAVYIDQPEPLYEASCMAPNSLHGAMHLARELMFLAEVKAPLATLRPTLVYGARDPHNGYGPNAFRRKANCGEDIMLFGEGEERRDHVLVDDVAELLVRMLYHGSTGGLNAATGVVHSFREIAQLAVRLSGRTVAVTGSPRKGAMPHNGYRPFDAAATQAAFPDFVYTPLSEGMARSQQEEFG